MTTLRETKSSAVTAFSALINAYKVTIDNNIINTELKVTHY